MILDPEQYKGREQTYIKHVFLDKYLKRVVYNILSWRKKFVYVDGFSGPWRSVHEQNEDTSIFIALSTFDYIRAGFSDQGQTVQFRAVFVEDDKKAYEELNLLLESFSQFELNAINGKFEDHIHDIIQFIGNDFSLIHLVGPVLD